DFSHGLRVRLKPDRLRVRPKPDATSGPASDPSARPERGDHLDRQRGPCTARRDPPEGSRRSPGSAHDRSMLVACSVTPLRQTRMATMSWRSASVADLDRERRLRRGEARDRHAIGRRADVVEADVVEEVHRGGVAAVLAADAELQVAARPPPALDAGADDVADAGDVDRRERILLEDLL